MRMKLFLISAMLFVALVSVSNAQRLPASAVKYLNDSYPGWKLYTLPRNSGCNPEFRGAVIFGDFDGNRNRDYVARITHKNNGYLIALMALRNGYISHILESGSSSDAQYMALSVARKGQRYNIGDPYEGDARTARLPNDAPVIGPCESHAYPYIYRNGRFQD